MYLWNNKLSDAIPSELGNLTNLIRLHLNENQLSGAIPPKLSNLNCGNHSDCVLDLSRNNLTGPIPPELGNLTCSSRSSHRGPGGDCTLNLSHNNLTGPIPPGLGGNLDCSSRAVFGYGGDGGDCTLDLSHNQLSGAIPAQLGNLNLDCSGGADAPGFGGGGDCALDLSHNNLTGAIPSYMGNLNLNCSGNRGSIGGPAGVCTLDLSHNNLSGAIPPELGNLELGTLWIHHNRLSGEIPATLRISRWFRFCNNRLTGALPVHLRTIVYFSGNIDDISSCYEGTFRDDDESVHLANIERIADLEITQGCGQQRFCPSRTVTRAQMAAFLHRAVTRLYGEPGSAEVQLTDVGADVWYRSYAQWAAANGVVRVTGGAFNPQGSVTRADMAEMLVAAFDHLTASSEFQDLFSDVSGIPYATIQAMEGIYDAGVTTGCGTNPLRYCPTKEVTRAQMASFLVRAINLASDNS